MARKYQPRKKSLEDSFHLLSDRYGGRLAPPLEGLAYRFTIWLPVQSRGRQVFTEIQQAHLVQLCRVCFGGCSQSNVEGFPPWSGSWLPEGTDEPIVDFHIQLVIYALQDAEAVACVRHLKWLLQQDHVAAQEVVLIEQVPVQFVAAAEMS